jgi:hypothetical protein
MLETEVEEEVTVINSGRSHGGQPNWWMALKKRVNVVENMLSG